MASSPATVMTAAITFALVVLIFGTIFLLQAWRDRRKGARFLEEATKNMNEVQSVLDRVKR